MEVHHDVINLIVISGTVTQLQEPRSHWITCFWTKSLTEDHKINPLLYHYHLVFVKCTQVSCTRQHLEDSIWHHGMTPSSHGNSLQRHCQWRGRSVCSPRQKWHCPSKSRAEGARCCRRHGCSWCEWVRNSCASPSRMSFVLMSSLLEW